MSDGEIDHIGNGPDGRSHPGNIHHRIAHGIVVVDADIGVVEEILPVRMADEMILRHFVLPIRRRHRNDLRAALFALLCRVDGRRVDADVVEEEDDVTFLDIVILDDRRAEIDGAFELKILERLIEDGKRRLH